MSLRLLYTGGAAGAVLLYAQAKQQLQTYLSDHELNLINKAKLGFKVILS